MAVSYKRLWKLLVDKKMSKADLRKKAEIAPNTNRITINLNVYTNAFVPIFIRWDESIFCFCLMLSLLKFIYSVLSTIVQFSISNYCQ